MGRGGGGGDQPPVGLQGLTMKTRRGGFGPWSSPSSQSRSGVNVDRSEGPNETLRAQPASWAAISALLHNQHSMTKLVTNDRHTSEGPKETLCAQPASCAAISALLRNQHSMTKLLTKDRHR
jgi:hypothetical protein